MINLLENTKPNTMSNEDEQRMGENTGNIYMWQTKRTNDIINNNWQKWLIKRLWKTRSLGRTNLMNTRAKQDIHVTPFCLSL